MTGQERRRVLLLNFRENQSTSSISGVTVVNGNNVDQIRQKLDYSGKRKVTERLRSFKPRYLDKLSFICFPLVFILYNAFYWTLKCI